MKPDEVIVLEDGSLLHHGPANSRIYLMKMGSAASPDLAKRLIRMAQEQGYSRVFAKVPAKKAGPFVAAGFVVEAHVPKLYSGEDDGICAGYFLDSTRAVEENAAELDAIITLANSKAEAVVRPLDDTVFSCRRCTPADVENMAKVYKTVFATYPFPIDDPAYLLQTMQEHVAYFCVEAKGSIVALSSSEMDNASGNAEMTDFATLPAWRGFGLAVHLLQFMDRAVAQTGIKTAYTIARALSAGMNCTFAKCGYRFGGRLKNSTNISGKIESMNVWYKSLTEIADI